ncbi:hypothetical protein ACHL6L_37140 [Amycolatopsis sp. A24]|uniref:Transposase n=1 Tax=Amycolatopsis bullii TaxID=941987 RepID=A0ABQ3KP36_9PSEU|nr:hypothetical protein [Amycolatopsis bullii]GHG41712.1 hypothetical protein GCM10017567_74200 [Amycolatopsis bullii]
MQGQRDRHRPGQDPAEGRKPGSAEHEHRPVRFSRQRLGKPFGPNRDLDADAGRHLGRRSAGFGEHAFAAQLVSPARIGRLQLTGEGGVLAQLTKRLVDSAFEGEITDHLG